MISPRSCFPSLRCWLPSVFLPHIPTNSSPLSHNNKRMEKRDAVLRQVLRITGRILSQGLAEKGRFPSDHLHVAKVGNLKGLREGRVRKFPRGDGGNPSQGRGLHTAGPRREGPGGEAPGGGRGGGAPGRETVPARARAPLPLSPRSRDARAAAAGS